jgi:iron complex outermembrane receptor protein/hemoglobin/transferrin/lactoferrin receptor protein
MKSSRFLYFEFVRKIMMSILQNRPLSVAIALLLAHSAVSAETLLNPVVVSASPLGDMSAFDSPTQVDQIAGEQKLGKDSGSLGALLADIPGVNNLGTGSQAGKPVIRGMSGERVKILSNGLATDSQAYGTRHNRWLPMPIAYIWHNQQDNC